MRERSNRCPDLVDTTGCSGVVLLMAQNIPTAEQAQQVQPVVGARSGSRQVCGCSTAELEPLMLSC
jgi:hypothetical protein